MKPPLKKPITCLITRGEADSFNFSREKEKILRIITAAIEARISLVQIREKQISARQLFELARAASEITSQSSTRLLINSRSDIALAAEADGVHLPANGVPADVVREFSPPGFLVGVSAHNEKEVVDAKRKGADFALFGPVYATPGKPAPVGVNELERVSKSVLPFPVIALGGIDEMNFEQILSRRTSGFAAIRFLNDETNLRMLGNLFAESK